jgi:endoglucanase
VDGKQVGGTQTVTADHASGQWQDITLTGNFGTGAHQIAVNFINDANDNTGGGDGHDRNLYIDYIKYDGQTLQGEAAQNNASLGYGALDPHAAVMVVNGTTTFQTAAASPSPAPAPAPAPSPAPAPTATSGLSTITVHASGDQYQGDPLLELLVDGKQVGGLLDVSASHSAGQYQDFTVTGNFSSLTGHTVALQFVNDLYNGPGQDRNAYIDYISVNGHVLQGEAATSNTASGPYAYLDPHAAVMVANGTVSFNVPQDYWHA